ncbi:MULTISPECIES: tail fiber assembly protein [unclassified Pseudomonas]|uniref:tail fiber assembly protein n=1 Tax=unclassified Pseudomonas TaxID=196821 RepID=UPI002AC9CE00|nr:MULTISPECIES: tail fiber assembly protein [unclassified Pseudomonas]MEB0044153.1 tail fiber assembly protein [Pseudomonas sp. Dout3]MEB0094910.1 tail fiber assembly protein [Pseudomonas sp. DC1.2]WPX59731.1 tail fiber assembly protein [Pseudomonas sp. DC1.2]
MELADELQDPAVGHAWALVDGAPLQLQDFRGTVYRTNTGAALIWNELGELPQGLTTSERPGPYHLWVKGKWMLDASAETAGLAKQALEQRTALMVQATVAIAPLLDAVELDMATEEERTRYEAWRRYRVLLNRVELQDGFPRAIEWPVIPA